MECILFTRSTESLKRQFPNMLSMSVQQWLLFFLFKNIYIILSNAFISPFCCSYVFVDCERKTALTQRHVQGESLEIWTQIPVCSALLSRECSTIQTKGVGGCGSTDKSQSHTRPPPTYTIRPPTPQAHRHTFHNIAARLRDHKTRAALGFCDALKQVFR